MIANKAKKKSAPPPSPPQTKKAPAHVATPAAKKAVVSAPAMPAMSNEDFQFVKDLIRDTNKEAGEKIAFNLAEDSAPTNVKRWIPTGSRQLDYIIANRKGGGYPEGRIIEIQGPQANGKSHLAIEASRATQRMGGIVVYIDAENATSLDNLNSLGLDVGKRFVYVQETCMEKIFSVIENVIIKARNMKSDLPILVIWDSVAASSPKAELEGDYEQNTIGLAARVLSKGFRKITHLIGDKNVCLLLINQQRMKIGCVNPFTTMIEATSVVSAQDDRTCCWHGTVGDFFAKIGHPFSTLEVDKPVEASGWKVRTINTDTGLLTWANITKIVRKQDAKHYQLKTETTNFELDASGDHKVFVKDIKSESYHYAELSKLVGREKDYLVRTIDGYETFKITCPKDSTGNGNEISIADIEVEGTHSYLSNEILSHNTLYGDPTCVSPKTVVKIRRKNILEAIKLGTLIVEECGISDLSQPTIVDISSHNLEIESFDTTTNQVCFKPLTHLVVKPSVKQHYQLGTLCGTSVHRVFRDDEWVELKNHPEAVLVDEPMQVVDVTVADTQTYLAEGQINHNTTPGGNAIPYHASLRLKLSGGQQIKKMINGREQVVGIAVDVKVIKNKVARPWRQTSFEIHFGKGIVESEQLFDELRQYCEKAGKALVDGKHISVSGTGAWKTFEVSDVSTGEVLHEIKFQKSSFQELVIDNPLVKKYFDDLVDAAFIIGNTADDHFSLASIDMESHEEVAAAKQVSETGDKSVTLLLND